MSTFDDLLKAKSGRANTPATQTAAAPPPQQPQLPSQTLPVQPTPAPQASPGEFESILRSALARAPIGLENVTREQCRPLLRADKVNLWSRIEQAIEVLYRNMLDACAALNIDAYVGRNNTFEFPFAVRFECWVPLVAGDPYLTERSSAYISIEPKPLHRYEMEYTVEIENCGRKKVLGTFSELRDSEVHALLTYLARHGPKPRFGGRIHRAGDPFWRGLTSVKNKPNGTRRDRLALLGTILCYLGLIGAIGFWSAGDRNAGLRALCAFSLFALASGVGISLYIGFQPLGIRSAGRPELQPRMLRLYDSWQAVLFGAAASASGLRQRFLTVLNLAPIEGFNASTERIGYRVLDESVFCEHIVLTRRRAIIYCQIYEFGSDLYVGWQSFLNQGRWIEKLPGERVVDRTTGRRVEVRAVVPGSEGLCEYDHADSNCLTEWTHAKIVMLTKQLMKELAIDQEIDFKIVRGGRGVGELSTGIHKPAKKKESGGFFRPKS
jgi:hypothetical protein